MLNKNYFLLFIISFITLNTFSQKDSLNVNSKYWEDQLYFRLSYNILQNQPSGVGPTNVSYGFSTGYIKDIPLNKKGSRAIGIGVGYSYDFFDQDLVVNSSDFIKDEDNTVNNNKLKIYDIELPIQFRIRTSDAVTYSFWRVYFGARFSYNLLHKFQYIDDGLDYEFKNLSTYNKFQSGIEFSAGYGAFNFYVYYALTPLFSNATLVDEVINTSILKLGLVFYLL